MRNHLNAGPFILACVLAGCPNNNNNPGQLWLSPLQMETKVQLIDHEPTPF